MALKGRLYCMKLYLLKFMSTSNPRTQPYLEIRSLLTQGMAKHYSLLKRVLFKWMNFPSACHVNCDALLPTFMMESWCLHGLLVVPWIIHILLQDRHKDNSAVSLQQIKERIASPVKELYKLLSSS